MHSVRQTRARTRPPIRTSALRYTVDANWVAADSILDGAWAGGIVGASSQSLEKLIGGVENWAEPAGRSVKFDLLFAFLPLRRPVPPLIGVALGARSKQNAAADDFSLEFVTVVQARGKPELLRQRQHHDVTIPALLTPAVRASVRACGAASIAEQSYFLDGNVECLVLETV